MYLKPQTAQEAAITGATLIAGSFVLPKVIKGKLSKQVSGLAFALGGLALLGGGLVMAEQKFLHRA
jgi:hypothetical protein